MKRRVEEILAHHTGQPLEKVSKDVHRDFVSFEGVMEYGVADLVVHQC